MTKKKATKEKDAWVVIRDGFVFEQAFDNQEEASIYCASCQRDYLGHFEVRSVNLNKFLHQIDEPLSNMQLARAMRELTK